MYVADGRWVGELIDVDGYAAMRFQTFLEVWNTELIVRQVTFADIAETSDGCD